MSDDENDLPDGESEGADTDPEGAEGAEPTGEDETTDIEDSGEDVSGEGDAEDTDGEPGDGEANRSPSDEELESSGDEEVEPSGDEEAGSPDEEAGSPETEEPLPDGAASIALWEAGKAVRSIPILVASVVWAILGVVAAAIMSPAYTRALDGLLSTASELPEDDLQNEEYEPLELVLGADPSVADVVALLEGLLSSGDVPATLVLVTFVMGLGPIVGILVTVPAVLRRRSDGHFRRLIDAGNAGWEVVVGTFLGRSVAVAYSFLAIAIGIAVGVTIMAEPVGLTYLVVVVLAILFVVVFGAAGTAVGTVAPSKLTAAIGSLVVWVVFYVLGTGPIGQGMALADGREGAFDPSTFVFGGYLPTVLQRFHPHNILLDNSVFVALSGAIESFPRVSFVAVPWILDHDLPPQEAVAELPIHLQHWFGYLALLAWVAVFLVVATVGLRPDLE